MTRSENLQAMLAGFEEVHETVWRKAG